MKIKWYKYNRDDAALVCWYLMKMGYGSFGDVEIIGSILKKGHSNHDIDIYLPNTEATEKNMVSLSRDLGCIHPQLTDWGGIYCFSTVFGDIDIFFKGQTNDFTF